MKISRTHACIRLVACLGMMMLHVAAISQTPKSPSKAQPKNKAAETTADGAGSTMMPFRVVEQMPEFQGSLPQWLAANIRYPDSARVHNAEGRSIVEFVVTDAGRIVKEKVVRTSGNRYLDSEALRAVRAMPAWKPGRQQGKSVNVIYTIPVTFRLEN